MRLHLCFSLLLLLASCQPRLQPATTTPAQAPQKKAPSVLFITIDALRADSTGFSAHPKLSTPVMKALAAQSLVYHQAVSQDTWTAASVPSFLSSNYPSTNGIVDFYSFFRLKNLPTFPRILRNHGYASSLYSAHQILFPLDLGMFDQQRNFPESSNTADKVVAAIEADFTPGQKPFFLWVYFMDLHEVRLRDPKSMADQNRQDFARRFTSQYYRKVEFIDAQIGKLLQILAAKGVSTDNLLIALNSDHGQVFDNHQMFFTHGEDVWEELVHVPLLISLPAPHRRRQDITCQVRLLDLAPTVLDAVGVPIPPEYEGHSLLRSEDQGGACTPLAIVDHIGLNDDRNSIPERKYSFRAYPWKFNYAQSGAQTALRLFNLETDPLEAVDLSSQEPQVMSRMTQALEAWLQRPSMLTSPDFFKLAPDQEDQEKLNEQLRSLGYME